MGGSSKAQVVGYQYHEDQHMVLALSNFDFISDIWFANKKAWAGKATGADDAWTSINVNQPSLFGGEKREGGVSGTIHIGMGYPQQPKLTQMVSRIGNYLMPAYRGVVSLFFEDFYFGNNPYLKELKVRAQAIHKLSDGSQQWYDATSEITSDADPIPHAIDYTDPTPFTGLGGDFLLEQSSLRITNPTGGQSLSLPIPDGLVLHFETSFVLNSVSLSDSSSISVPGVFFIPRFQNLPNQGPNDPLQRAYLNAQPITDDALPLGSYTLTCDFAATEMTYVLKNSSGVVVATGTQAVNRPLIQNFDIVWNSADPESLAGPYEIHWLNTSLLYARQTGDINPIHFIRECHTDTIWGGRYPQSKMGSSYTTAAETLFAEGLGVSFLFTEEIKWREIIDEVARHIDAISYQDPDTGLMEIKLIRDDYDVATLPLLDPSNSDLERINDPFENEIFNAVIIEFWNSETGEDDSITLSDAAAVDMVGFINSKTFSYSGITNKRTATIVGNRDLARSSRPFYQGRVKTNRSVANLKPGDVFRLTSPDDGIAQIVCRVTKRSESGLLNGDITLEFGEDIFGKVYTTFVQPNESVWVDPIGNPKAFEFETAFEIPYYLVVQDRGESATASLSVDACFYGFSGGRPASGAHIDYDLYVYPDGTTQEPDPEFSIAAPFTPVAIVTNDVLPGGLTISVEPLTGMESVRVGQLIMAGDGLDTEREFLVVDAAVANGDTVLTVRRGLIDTTPKQIPAGTTLYFVETFYGGSETEYLPGETVEGYGAPSNGSGSYQGPFTYHDLLMAGRFNKPYPPANFKIDGLYFPGSWYVPPANQIVFTWSHRDRVLQSDQAIDWFDTADYGPEALTTYLFEADAYDYAGGLITAGWVSVNVGLVKTYTLDLDTSTPPAGTRVIVVHVWTIRDGEPSLQAATYTFLAPGSEVMADEYTGLPVLDADGNYILMETP